MLPEMPATYASDAINGTSAGSKTGVRRNITATDNKQLPEAI
jgi:hypothetical protein